jgi:carboxypeptidase C (cathepsin A)
MAAMTEKAATATATVQTAPSASPESQDRIVITQHRVSLGRKKLAYTVTAGTIVLKEEREAKGEREGEFEGERPVAELFFIAYTLDGVKDPSSRPVTFSFNGGPGSSSVWLHLGLLGPKRVAMDEVGNPLPPPYQLIDNEHTLLTASDLVFIDPVSTGYSRPVKGEKAKAFHDFEKDIASVGGFIRLYATRYGRWTSPKFLVGESYGTTRAAGLSHYLQERHGMYLNGVMLVSSILDFQTARFDVGNDLPYLLYLPSYAATAHYHGKLPQALQERPLEEVLREVEAFALGEYASALLQGSSLSERRAARVARALSRYTGLSRAFIERCNLRVEIMRFAKELCRDERRTVGRLDSRFKGIDRDSAGEHFEYDPSYATIQGPFTATFNDYVRRDLGFESDLTYEILKGLYQHWSFKGFENRYLNVAEKLRKALTQNPHLKVHVASGYYDLATPYFASEYTVNHLGLEPELRANIASSTYDAGHMMYVHQPSLGKLNETLSAFIAQSASATSPFPATP